MRARNSAADLSRPPLGPPLACALAVLLLLPLGRPVGARPARAHRELSRDTLAWAGSRVVTAEDLKRRIELMPWMEKQMPGATDTASVRAVEALMAEKLLAQEAERQGLGAGGRVEAMRAALLRALARDALYRREVAGDSLRARAILMRVMAGRRAVVDRAVFLLLCDSLRIRMQATQDARAGRAGRVKILSEDVDFLISRLAPHLKRTLVRLPGRGLTLEEALEDLRFYDFSVRSLEPRAFAIDVNAHLRVMMERDLLAREAIRQHLDRLPEVMRDLEMWTDTWRAGLLAARVAASVPDSGGGAAGRTREASPAEQRSNRVDRYVARLAGRSRVRLNVAATQAQDILRQNMLTRRLLGFGGSMLAAPTLAPMWGWAPLWRASMPALP